MNADNIGCILNNVVNSISDSITAGNEALTSEYNLHGWDNTEVYFTRTKNDYDAMTEILENRTGKSS